MIKLALSALSEFLSMRDQWIELAERNRDSKDKFICLSNANKRRCQGLVMHDRILTGKRPL